jgi:ribose-phosphate pyrophosphokinase
MIRISSDTPVIVKIAQLIFPSGETHVRIENPGSLQFAQHIYFTFNFRQDTEMVQLIMLVDAVRRINNKADLYLDIPYFPGARQDRVCYPGEALSVKVYADIINSLNFTRVRVFDPHSEVTTALVNNISVDTNENLVSSALHTVLKGKRKATIVSPDAGANKKIFNLCKQLKHLEITVVRADKKRDTKDGKILGTEVFIDDLKGEDCFIIDDICSRGGTFIALAKALKEKNAGDIYLIVSHYEGTAVKQQLQDAGITRVFIGNNLSDMPLDKYITLM